MASEPSAKAGPNEAEETAPLPTSAEDRKAAAALSKLDTRGEDESAAPAKEVDADALGKAMQNLSVAEGGEQADADRKKKTAEENKKKVKVDAVDVTLLIKELDLTKAKATELLKAHEGDAIKAMTAFVTAPGILQLTT